MPCPAAIACSDPAFRLPTQLQTVWGHGSDDLSCCRQELANARQLLATPVEITVVEQEARHAEYTGIFCLSHDRLQFATTLALNVADNSADVGTASSQHGSKRCWALDVELALPEPLEHT